MSSSSTTAAAMDSDSDLLVLLNSQRDSLAESKHIQSDLDYAFKLQLQEALTASLSNSASSSTSSPPPITFPIESYSDDLALVTDLFEEEIARYQQSQSDKEYSMMEQKRSVEELSLRLHDRRFATEIMKVPESEWKITGDDFAMPFGEGSSSSSSASSAAGCLIEREVFTVYTKGVMMKIEEEEEEEEEGEGGRKKRKVGAVGVVVCGSMGNVVLEMAKAMEGVMEEMSQETVELEAVIEGLEMVVSLGLRRVSFCCEKWLYDYVTGKNQDMNETISKLVKHVELCQNNFISCTPSLVAGTNNNYAFKLASDAIASQTAKPAVHKELKETCFICIEEFVSRQMFTVDGCQHRCCNSCMKKHLEVKLVQGELPKCPNAGCGTDIEVDSCKKLLGPKLHETMSQLVKEASIPVTKKVYCPDPRCSTLMSKDEVLEYSNARSGNAAETGACFCIKCQKPFCISCRVPWHAGMTCLSYRKVKPDPDSADTKLKSLATTKRWQQCPKCRHMIELVSGCFHISCKCGHEFCYTCGAEFRNKKATCPCVLWEEHNIIHN